MREEVREGSNSRNIVRGQGMYCTSDSSCLSGYSSTGFSCLLLHLSITLVEVKHLTHREREGEGGRG